MAVPPERDDESVREFASFTADLHRLADWLRDLPKPAGVFAVTGDDEVTELGEGAPERLVVGDALRERRQSG